MGRLLQGLGRRALPVGVLPASGGLHLLPRLVSGLPGALHGLGRLGGGRRRAGAIGLLHGFSRLRLDRGRLLHQFAGLAGDLLLLPLQGVQRPIRGKRVNPLAELFLTPGQLFRLAGKLFHGGLPVEGLALHAAGGVPHLLGQLLQRPFRVLRGGARLRLTVLPQFIGRLPGRARRGGGPFRRAFGRGLAAHGLRQRLGGLRHIPFLRFRLPGNPLLQPCHIPPLCRQKGVGLAPQFLLPAGHVGQFRRIGFPARGLGGCVGTHRRLRGFHGLLHRLLRRRRGGFLLLVGRFGRIGAGGLLCLLGRLLG